MSAANASLTWAATGHRPDRLGGYGDDVHRRLVDLACGFLVEFNPSRMISGMAIGWDIAVAEACVRCNVPFVAAVPFEGQESKWPDAAQARYRTLMRWAERVHVVSPGSWSNAAFHARNRWMVDQCDAIVALWDGSATGGTAACIDYARRARKDMINLWDSFFR